MMLTDVFHRCLPVCLMIVLVLVVAAVISIHCVGGVLIELFEETSASAGESGSSAMGHLPTFH